MDSTSVSLLRRLREPAPEEAWRRFVALYAPLIFHWGRGQGLSATDSADLVQEVLAILVARLPEFEYDPARRFRGWLRTIAVNKARDFQRRAAVRPTDGDAALPGVSVASDVDLLEEAEYRHYLVNRAMDLMRAEFRDATWQACWRHVVEDRPAAEIARELGMTANAVYVAKSRVLRRLREELSGLWE